MTERTLEPIGPEAAVELYLNAREAELAESTLDNQRRHLTAFTEWCQREGIENLNELTGRLLHEYRLWRQDGLAQTTLSINLSTVRQFLRWAESIDAVPTDLADAVILPSRDREAEARDEMLAADDAAEILNYLRTYEYATREHAVLATLWHTGVRKGTLRALDLDDFHRRDKTLEPTHRPESETPLKNGHRGQRVIALTDDVASVLADYVDVHRLDKTDEYGREPLFTTRYGRISPSAIKDVCYTMTRPCVYSTCPHNRDPEECEAMADQSSASLCPSSVSPHPVRRGSITHHLLNDVPETAVSDRCNVSPDVLEHHYDERTEHEKAEQRRQHLDGL